MVDFSTSAELELEVPNRTLRDARSKIEQELGTVEVGISGDAGGGGEGTQLDTILDVNRQQLELAEDRNAFLEEMQDELEAGGGGGGEGGGGLPPGLGLLAGGVGGGGLLGGALALSALGVIFGEKTGIEKAETTEEQLQTRGEEGGLTGSRFDPNAPEPIVLSEELRNWEWPEPQEPIVLSDALRNWEWPEMPEAEIALPSERGGTGGFGSGRGDLEGRGRTFRTRPNGRVEVDNRTTYNIEQTADVDEAVDEVRREQQRDLERLERRIKQNLPAGY